MNVLFFCFGFGQEKGILVLENQYCTGKKFTLFMKEHESGK